MGLAFQAVLCSPKLRSRQTAEIVAQAVGFPVSHIYETEALKPTAPARDTLEQVRRFEKARAVFAAGHLPNLAEAVSLMACKGGRLELNIENAGLARIDLDLESGYGRLLWHLSAQHLQLIAQTL
jgi:phosphohistidine phosphatase